MNDISSHKKGITLNQKFFAKPAKQKNLDVQ